MLQANCPTCNATLEAKTLQALKRLVQKHCRDESKAREAIKAVIQGFRVAALTSWEFDRDILSANKTTYAHWSVYDRDKRDWADRIRLVAPTMGGQYARSLWHMIRIYGGRSREMDDTNFRSGFKPVLDCLTENHVILDDRPSCFKADYSQLRDPNPGAKTRIRITLIEGFENGSYPTPHLE